MLDHRLLLLDGGQRCFVVPKLSPSCDARQWRKNGFVLTKESILVRRCRETLHCKNVAKESISTWVKTEVTCEVGTWRCLSGLITRVHNEYFALTEKGSHMLRIERVAMYHAIGRSGSRNVAFGWRLPRTHQGHMRHKTLQSSVTGRRQNVVSDTPLMRSKRPHPSAYVGC